MWKVLSNEQKQFLFLFVGTILLFSLIFVQQVSFKDAKYDCEQIDIVEEISYPVADDEMIAFEKSKFVFIRSFETNEFKKYEIVKKENTSNIFNELESLSNDLSKITCKKTILMLLNSNDYEIVEFIYEEGKLVRIK